MECFQKFGVMFEDLLFDPAEVGRPHPTVSSEANVRFKPELALTVRGPDMNVRWFISLI